MKTEGENLETSIVIPDFVDARIGPRGSLENLSQAEIEKLLDSRAGGLYPLFRKCARPSQFRQRGPTTPRNLRPLQGLRGGVGPSRPGASSSRSRTHRVQAFVDGEMIRGMKEHVSRCCVDVIFISNESAKVAGRSDNPAAITNAVFHILRNARILDYKSNRTWWCAGDGTRSTPRVPYTKK